MICCSFCVSVKKLSNLNMMKKIFLIPVVLLFFSCKNESDRKPHENTSVSDSLNLKTDTETLPAKNDLTSVEGIKKEYNLLNSKLLAKKLDSSGFAYECEENSGNVVYYSENGKVKVIRHFSADSHYSSSESYFINNDQPFFVFKDETVWSFDGGTPEKPETKDDITQKRIYFSGKTIIQCLEKKFTLRSNSADHPDPEKIPNKENKKCSAKEVSETFALLVQNKTKKGTVQCL